MRNQGDFMFRSACGMCLAACLFVLAACAAQDVAPSETSVRVRGDVTVYGVYRTHAQFAD